MLSSELNRIEVAADTDRRYSSACVSARKYDAVSVQTARLPRAPWESPTLGHHHQRLKTCSTACAAGAYKLNTGRKNAARQTRRERSGPFKFSGCRPRVPRRMLVFGRGAKLTERGKPTVAERCLFLRASDLGSWGGCRAEQSWLFVVVRLHRVL